MRIFTREQADKIVEALGAKNGYSVHKVRGTDPGYEWMVWDTVSDHHVEVDPETVAALCRKVRP